MDTEEITVYWYDGPLPPETAREVLLTDDGRFLIYDKIGEGLTDKVNGPIYRTVGMSERANIDEWFTDELQGFDIEELGDESRWWEERTVEFVTVNDSCFIVDEEKEVDTVDYQFFRVNDKNVYTNVRGGRHITDFSESEESDGEYCYHLRSLEGFTRQSITTEKWDELVENGDVDVLYPIFDSLSLQHIVVKDRSLGISLD